MVRQFLKPGITGWAQTEWFQGKSPSEQIKMRVDKDLWYLENWNLWLDIQILFSYRIFCFQGRQKCFLGFTQSRSGILITII